jgi:hypothetical protein
VREVSEDRLQVEVAVGDVEGDDPVLAQLRAIPISSTRQAAGGAGVIPNRVAWVASLSGCVCSYA